VDMLMFPEDIMHTLCPFLRISPFPVASNQETETQHRMPLMVRIEVAIVGTNTDVLMNFYHAVRSAIYPQNNVALRDGIRSMMHTAGSSWGETKLPAYGAFRDRDDIPFLAA